MVYVYALELVGREKRVLSGIVTHLSFTIGQVLIGGVAYALKDWRQSLLYLTVALFIFVPLWPFLPESVRWMPVGK